VTGGIAEPSTSDTALSPARSWLATAAAAAVAAGFAASSVFFTAWD